MRKIYLLVDSDIESQGQLTFNVNLVESGSETSRRERNTGFPDPPQARVHFVQTLCSVGETHAMGICLL